MKKSAIIVAGGIGTRFNAAIPKQFMPLGGMPLLLYSIDAFRNAFRDITLVVVLPPDHIGRWKEICHEFHLAETHRIVAGGHTRFQSVKNGLEAIEPAGLVGIHDGARPLITPALILRCFEVGAQHGSCIPVIPVTDSVRSVAGDHHAPVDRTRLRLIQTPQVFMASFIKKSYDQPYHESFTDDAMVAESAGGVVRLDEGDPENIKITGPNDLVIAEALLALRRV